jgi:hypothetical protein
MNLHGCENGKKKRNQEKEEQKLEECFQKKGGKR